MSRLRGGVPVVLALPLYHASGKLCRVAAPGLAMGLNGAMIALLTPPLLHLLGLSTRPAD